MAWLLGELHRGLIATSTVEGGGKKAGGGGGAASSSSIISQTFGGIVELTTMTKGEKKSVEAMEQDMAVDESQLPMSGE